MAGTGKVIALIKALGGSGASPEEIKAAVAEWLAEHVDPETGYVLDDTLSIAGAAADAKAAGDAVDELKSAINVLEPAATSADVGKALIAKTVADGKVTEYEFGEAGSVQPDGYYQGMTVGNAEQLVATVGIEDKVPYNFRTSGGSADIGDREVDKLIGGTVAFNQSMDKANYPASSGIFTNNGDGSVTATGSASETVTYAFKSDSPSKLINGHKYCVLSGLTTTGSGATHEFMITGALGNSENLNVYSTAGTIFSANSAGGNTYQFVIRAGNTVSNLKCCPQLFDLTQMFGSTIADYIYSLETATAGAGVAWFRKLFPKPYYAYNEGELMSVQTSGHKMVGFNQFDKSGTLTTGYLYENNTASSNASYKYTDYIRIVGGATYHVEGIGGSNPSICWYDADKNYIAGAKNNEAVRKNITFPSNACYVRISFPAANVDTLVFNLHWDGERDGEYEPYVQRTYPLDDVVLRGIPKLDANNNLYYDGDIYESDGTVNRNWVLLDLGSVEWVSSVSDTSGYSRFMTYDLQIPGEATQSGNLPNIVCTKYVANTGDRIYTRNIGITLSSTGRIVVYDPEYAQGVPSAFKAAMSGVYAIYKAATPTTESADPYTNPQIVDDFGTEEYIDTRTIPIPVGHDTMYRANLRAKLEMAPNSPEGNGDYIVRQTSGVNEYVPLEKELPSYPSSDGNYHLKLTVSGSTKTLTWEADT